MEPFEISCEHCSQRLRVKDPALIGRKVKCPGCGQRMLITEPSDAHTDELAGSGSNVVAPAPTRQEAAAPKRSSPPARAASPAPGRPAPLPPPADSLLQALSQKEAFHESGVWGKRPPAAGSSTQNGSGSSEFLGGSDSAASSTNSVSASAAPAPREARGMQLDRKSMMMMIGISTGVTALLVFVILVSKGYLFNNSKYLKRSDASRFAEFGREVEKSMVKGPAKGNSAPSTAWQPEPPTATANALKARLTKLVADAGPYPALLPKALELQASFRSYSSRHAAGTLTHLDFNQRLATLNTRAGDLEDEVEAAAGGSPSKPRRRSDP